MKHKQSLRRTCVLLAALSVTAYSSLMLAEDAGTPWVAPARAARKKNPIASDDKSIAAGKAVYVAQCLKCHGDSGRGDGPSAKDLKPRPKDLADPAVSSQSDGALFWKITTGRAPMPTFETLVSEEDRWNTVNYLRALAPATQPASGK
jgi:mono/diheme cytochrome c family protein